MSGRISWAEYTVKEAYEDHGYDVIHTGVPDLILLKDGKIEFVEVKTAKDKLRDNQIRALELLRKHGFEARVESIRALRISESKIPLGEQKRIMAKIANDELSIGELWNLVARSSAQPVQTEFTQFLIVAFNEKNARLDEEDPL